MKDPLRIEFNEWARDGRGESMERGHRPVGEQALELLNVQPDARVLDIGCGSGWASRLLAEKASAGHVTGIDISDEMIRVASDSSTGFKNLDFKVASAEDLPFADNEFSDAFSMESLYYYADMSQALKEIHRVLQPGGFFLNVVDLYAENKPSHQWIETLKVPVHLLSTNEYVELFAATGFVEIKTQRIIDPAPLPEHYSGTSFDTEADYFEYRAAGSLMVSGRVPK